MTDNPYSAPESDVAPEDSTGPIQGSGTFVLEKCLSDGWNMTLAHIGLILGSAFVMFLLMMLGYFTIIGIFLIIPVLIWGGTRFALNVHDDRPMFSDIFSGFTDYGKKLLPSLILAGCLLVLGLIGSSVNLAGSAMDSLFIGFIGSLISIAFNVLVMSRFSFAFLFLVDRDMQGTDALKASWEATGPIWGRMIILSIVATIISMLGVLALVIGLLISIPVSYLMVVSAYRQVAGRPA